MTIATMICGVMLTNCDKIEKPEASVVDKIEAKVENASKYSNIVAVKLIVYAINAGGVIELARGDWKGDGFTIVFPEMVNPNYLQVSQYNRGLLEPIDNTSLNMTISNRNAKATTAHFWGIDKEGNLVTSFYPLKINGGGNANEVFFSYVNSDVTITGHNETKAVQDFEVNGTRHIALVRTSTTYSINLKKGWNAWWLSNIRCEQNFTITNKWSSAPIDKQKWFSFEDKWAILRN